ncbi:MAG: DMT family transporter [Acidobacteriaceae bacterium]|jgi:drug/metabolite transporter (DMT)-like permease
MNSLLRGNALFALAAAALWGGGDFSGGMGVNSAGGGVRAALRVVLLSHITSFAVLLAIARVRGDVFPQGALLAWGVAAGVAGGLALTCFYLALSRGAMGASAAVSGLLAAAIPAALTLWQEGSPGALPLVGFAVAGLAIWLIAAGGAEGDSAAAGRGSMALAMLAGVGFGFYFVALKMAGPGGVIWPMATARMGSLSICGLMLLGHTLRPWREDETPARFGRRAVGWSLATALLDTSGNLLFLAATRAGRLDVAAVLASLYPASTILLAALALGERPTRRQALGMATAVVAVALIAM